MPRRGRYVWMFSYGACLNKALLGRRIGAWAACAPAVLGGWTLRFENYSPRWRSGVANIVPASDAVFGAAYRITPAQLKKLDGFEGRMYRREWVRPVCRGRELLAVAYVLRERLGSRAPSKRYLNAIIGGLRQHGYPPAAAESVRREAGGARKK